MFTLNKRWSHRFVEYQFVTAQFIQTAGPQLPTRSSAGIVRVELPLWAVPSNREKRIGTRFIASADLSNRQHASPY